MNIIKKKRIGAYAIIIRGNKIALVKKANGGYKGKYDLPGGGIEHGEDIIITLHRECMEEINGTVIWEELFDVASTCFKWNIDDNTIEHLHHIGVLYLVNIKEDDIKNDADGLDSLGGEWLDINTLNKDNLSFFAYYALKKLNYLN